MHDLVHYLLGAGSGMLVGFVLALVGGGGSILAVPLMVYVVGVQSPHIAVGTSALAVAVSAATGLANHAAAGNVNWRCASMFAASGVIGALLGSTAGKAFDGRRLLFLFAFVMIAVGVMMLRSREQAEAPHAECNRTNAPKVIGYGALTGAFSGFFGIGGGFLIVPGLVAASGMPLINAIGSSLVSVFAFGATTAINYAASGLVDWLLAGAFIAGGLFGGLFGAAAVRRLSAHRKALSTIFASLLFAVAGYVIWQSRTSW
ncbi:MAG: sulfite exporter TauE/SafE family protein [Rhodospirillaceae bacterium]